MADGSSVSVVHDVEINEPMAKRLCVNDGNGSSSINESDCPNAKRLCVDDSNGRTSNAMPRPSVGGVSPNPVKHVLVIGPGEQGREPNTCPRTSFGRSVACPEGFTIVDDVLYHACQFDSTPKRQRTSSPILDGPILDDNVPASSAQVSRFIVCAACGAHCTCNGGEDPRRFDGRLCQSLNSLQPRCFEVVDK